MQAAMGTDVHLKWKGMTREDEEKQLTCFRINAGDVGYIRASIGMVRENKVLHQLFAENYWDLEIDCDEPYDFKANYALALSLGMPYLVGCVTGKDVFPVTEQQEQTIKTGELIMQTLQKAGLGRVSQIGNNPNGSLQELRTGVMWLNSLFSFLELGIEKQEAGLEPYPCISW